MTNVENLEKRYMLIFLYNKKLSKEKVKNKRRYLKDSSLILRTKP